MNSADKKVAKDILKAIESPHVPGTTYETNAEGGFRVVGKVATMAEIDRKLAEGSDYRAGWSACAERVREFLALMGIK